MKNVGKAVLLLYAALSRIESRIASISSMYYLTRLFETFKSQQLNIFDEVLYGKDELLHGK